MWRFFLASAVLYFNDGISDLKGDSNSMDTTLIQEYRGGLLECVHRGHICVVDEHGHVMKYVGDPHYKAFTRSSAKPIQAIPAIRAGMIENFGLTEEEIAIMTASHRGEHIHVQALEHLMKKTNLQEDHMVCAPSLPLDQASAECLLREGGQRRRMYHNCAGKHLGILAYCKMMNLPQEGYSKREHPVQEEIADTLANLANIPREEIGRAIDGCGLPVFNLPLSALATAYMKLACPDLIEDSATARAVTTITSAMNHYPHLVGGRGKVDSIMLEDDNLIAKGGFKGVFAFSLRKERLGVAFKVADGSEEEWGLIALGILEQLGYSNPNTLQQLRDTFSTEINNDEGWSVGHVESVFNLNQ
ncbi:L-asparaginase II [compost metagenome]